MRRIKTTSRVFEQILSIIGSVVSLINGSLVIFIESGGHLGHSFIAIISILGAVLGFISSFYVTKDSESAGVGFIIAAILILMSVPHWGIVASVILLTAGISTLFRK